MGHNTCFPTTVKFNKPIKMNCLVHKQMFMNRKPSKYLPVQGQQQKQQEKVSNMFKV